MIWACEIIHVVSIFQGTMIQPTCFMENWCLSVGCGGHSVSRAGAKIDLLPILLPIVGVIAIVVICAAFTYKYRQK